MSDRRPLASVLFAMLVSAPGPALAGGFEVPTQGSKADAMAGAFVAQADDPTAIFYNPAGIVLAPATPNRKLVAVGAAPFSLNELDYQGQAPGIGAGGTAEQESSLELAAHAYLVQPIGERGAVGVGLFTPYLLANEWATPGAYAGRYIDTSANLTTLDLNPCAAWRVTPGLAIAAGAVYRVAELDLERRLPGTNPFTGATQDFASVAVKTDLEGALGWNLGLLFRPSERFSIGAAYRSEVSLDVSGEGRMTAVDTGNQQLNDLIAATLPLDQGLAVDSSLDFPDSTSVGVAFATGGGLTLEVAATLTGWSRVERIPVVFRDNPELSQSFELAFDDSTTLRLGGRYQLASGFELRAGVAIDESPQPDATVGALLADADRTVLAFGFGRDWLDVAMQWVELDSRTVSDSLDGLNGTYSGSLLRLGLTVSK